MKIIYKLLLGFVLVLSISLISSIMIKQLIDGMDSQIMTIENEKYPINKIANNYQRGASQLSIGTFIWINGDELLGKQLIESGKKAMSSNRVKLEVYFDADVLNDYKSREEQAIQTSDEIIALLDKDASFAGTSNFLVKMDLLQRRISNLNLALYSLVDKSEEEMTRSLYEAKENAKTTRMISNNSLYVSLFLSIIISLLISLLITKPIKQLTDVAKKISVGDFNVTLPVLKTKDEITDLNESIKGVLAAVEFLTDRVKDDEKKVKQKINKKK